MILANNRLEHHLDTIDQISTCLQIKTSTTVYDALNDQRETTLKGKRKRYWTQGNHATFEIRTDELTTVIIWSHNVYSLQDFLKKYNR